MTDPADSTTDEETEVERLPSPPHGVSRIDTLADGFIKSISRRPHVIGDVIATRYKLVENLGEGGMGQVFVAENLAIGRRVAVKLLKTELLSDASFRKRFQYEAMAIAAIEHRNVIRFIDLIAGDPTFLVMEYVAGPTLLSVLKQEKKLDVTRAVNIALRLAWGLEAAHRAKVIHRDIKPANVILAPDPEQHEEPKLIDFGLAKLPTIVGAEELTRTGQIIGTPKYMSPEQISNKDVDPRSDVYSLACLLYHMLTGRPPFIGGDDVQILYQQIQNVPEPLRQHVPEAPEALEAILKRALAKQPGERPQSMRELAAALLEVDRRRSTTGAHTPAPSPKPRRKGIWLASMAAALAAGAAAAHFGERALGGRSGGLIIVTSRPAGASVELDGKAFAESTPTSLRGVPAGKHRVRVHQPGRDAVEQVLTLSAGERVALDIALPAASHPVEVQSVPSGASVYLDNAQIPGATPLTLLLVDDDFHEIRVEKLGYEPEVKRIAPEDRDPMVSLPLRPERMPRGLLMVDSSVAAEVWIDGKNSGYMTPTVGIQVATGERAVELRDSGGVISSTSHVNVKQGEMIHLTLNPRVAH